MTVELNILAQGGEGGGQFFGVIAVLVLLAIGWVANQVTKKKQEQQRRQQADKWREERQHPPQPGQPPRPQPAAPPQRQPSTAAQEVARAFREALGLEQAEAPVRPPPPPVRPQAQPRRPKRKKPVPPPVAMEDETPHLTDVAPLPAAGAKAPMPALRPAHILKLNLKDPEHLRQAILAREILAPPKALRQGEETWEL